MCPVPAQPSCTPAQRSPPNPFPEVPWTTDESELPLLFDVNPKQGSTTGGDEIYLIVKNLPSNGVLYARFGDNVAPTVSSLIGSDPAERDDCTDGPSLVSHCGRGTFLLSPCGRSSRSCQCHTMPSAFRSRGKLWEVSGLL